MPYIVVVVIHQVQIGKRGKAPLQVYDGDKLLYKKKLEPEFTIIQGLDLSNLESGNYNAVLATENSHFEYPVKLK